eukprot:scaffold756_cov158-Amphora_coffeaeformis.AAC.4
MQEEDSNGTRDDGEPPVRPLPKKPRTEPAPMSSPAIQNGGFPLMLNYYCFILGQKCPLPGTETDSKISPINRLA